jgi:hypothetical protein
MRKKRDRLSLGRRRPPVPWHLQLVEANRAAIIELAESAAEKGVVGDVIILVFDMADPVARGIHRGILSHRPDAPPGSGPVRIACVDYASFCRNYRLAPEEFAVAEGAVRILVLARGQSAMMTIVPDKGEGRGNRWS